ncbi:hypothetical protein R83H12_03067 [Fibrobacteria bacterium R8-3-H12]
MAQNYDIFISYRRKGGVQDARLMDEKLRNSGYSVSFDIDTLGRGKFTDTLKKRLEGCKDFIVIFEPSYYERFYDENGYIQPEDVLNQDWCYLELKNALQFNKNIIPLVHKDFVFPSNLPKDIKDVAEMNSIQLSENEFKEIFEYKIKSYLISKPKFTYRHKKSIIAALSLAVLATIAYLINFSMESQRKAARAETEAARTAFVLDSIKKLGEAQTKSILDSVKAKETEKRAVVSNSKAIAKTELYWVANGDETGKIIFGKLAGAGLKSGKCSEGGIKISVSKPDCKPSATGLTKCSYAPQLTASTCEGKQKLALSHPEINRSDKDEAKAKSKMLEELQQMDFSDWVGKLKSLRM